MNRTIYNLIYIKEYHRKSVETWNSNVIVTHLGPGSGSSFKDYFQAVANARVVGLEIAHLVNSMVTVCAYIFFHSWYFRLIYYSHSISATERNIDIITNL